MAKDKILYIVTYGWRPSNSSLGVLTIGGSTNPAKKFESRDEMESWVEENVEELKDVEIYEVAKVFKIKREPVKLRLVQS